MFSTQETTQNFHPTIIIKPSNKPAYSKQPNPPNPKPSTRQTFPFPNLQQ